MLDDGLFGGQRDVVFVFFGDGRGFGLRGGLIFLRPGSLLCGHVLEGSGFLSFLPVALGADFGRFFLLFLPEDFSEQAGLFFLGFLGFSFLFPFFPAEPFLFGFLGDVFFLPRLGGFRFGGECFGRGWRGFFDVERGCRRGFGFRGLGGVFRRQGFFLPGLFPFFLHDFRQDGVDFLLPLLFRDLDGGGGCFRFRGRRCFLVCFFGFRVCFRRPGFVGGGCVDGLEDVFLVVEGGGGRFRIRPGLEGEGFQSGFFAVVVVAEGCRPGLGFVGLFASGDAVLEEFLGLEFPGFPDAGQDAGAGIILFAGFDLVPQLHGEGLFFLGRFFGGFGLGVGDFLSFFLDFPGFGEFPRLDFEEASRGAEVLLLEQAVDFPEGGSDVFLDDLVHGREDVGGVVGQFCGRAVGSDGGLEIAGLREGLRLFDVGGEFPFLFDPFPALFEIAEFFPAEAGVGEVLEGGLAEADRAFHAFFLFDAVDVAVEFLEEEPLDAIDLGLDFFGPSGKFPRALEMLDGVHVVRLGLGLGRGEDVPAVLHVPETFFDIRAPVADGGDGFLVEGVEVQGVEEDLGGGSPVAFFLVFVRLARPSLQRRFREGERHGFQRFDVIGVPAGLAAGFEGSFHVPLLGLIVGFVPQLLETSPAFDFFELDRGGVDGRIRGFHRRPDLGAGPGVVEGRFPVSLVEALARGFGAVLDGVGGDLADLAAGLIR